MLIQLNCTFAYSQIADLSYFSDEVNVNPAVVSRRNLKIFGLATNYESEKVELSSYSRSISISKNELIYAHSKTFLVPEIYFQYGKGSYETDNKITSANTLYEQEIAFGQLNLATSGTGSFQVGLQMFQAIPLQGGGGGVTASGFGSRWSYSPNLCFGGYWRKLPTSNPENSSDVTQWSLGTSYLSGSPQSQSLRIEASYGQMSPIMPETISADARIPGEQLMIVAESSMESFLAGLRFQQTRGVYLDLKNVLKDSLYSTERPLSDYLNSFEVLFSLRSKRGHSFGISGLHFKGEQIVFISGIKAKAEVTTTSGRLSYSYRY